MRVAGVNLDPKKHIRVALLKVFGIGLTRALEICKKLGIDPSTKIADLSDKANDIQKAVQNYVIEGDLRREIATNIKRLKEIGSYRGKRHKMNLPVRGQNTKNNARTRKGKKKSQAGKKK